MPAVVLKKLYEGPIDDFPREGVEFSLGENPLIIPSDKGVAVVTFAIVPTEEEKRQIAGMIEAQQKSIGNPVKVEVKDVQEKPAIDPEKGAVGTSKSISIKVVPAPKGE